VKLHLSLFSCLLDVAAKTRDLGYCREVFRRIDTYGFRPNIISYCLALKAGHRARDLKFSLEFWKQMENDGVMPNLIAFNTIIATCAELSKEERSEAFPAYRIKLADSFFKTMSLKGIEPDTVTYGAMLNVLARAGHWERALKLEKEMLAQGYELDEVCWTTLISACNQSKQYEKALEVYSRAWKLGKADNTIAHSAVMNALCELDRTKDVQELYQNLPKEGIDVVVFNIYLRSLAMTGEVDKIEQALAD